MHSLIKVGVLAMLSVFIIMYVLQRTTSLQTWSKDHLYIMKDHRSGLYKIGRSNDPERRVKEVDYHIDGRIDGNVRLIKTFRHKSYLETPIHRSIKDRQVLIDNLDGSCGTEWYRLTSKDIQEIEISFNL